MKTLVLALAVSFVAQASTVHKFDFSKAMSKQEVGWLSVDLPGLYRAVGHCSKEDQEALRTATALTSLSFMDNRNRVFTYGLEAVGVRPVPSGSRFKLSLRVTGSPIPETNPVPDKPTEYDIECELKTTEIAD